jgi:hypothetical protein
MPVIKQTLFVLLALLSTTAIAAVAATTIGTNIDTEGNLTVTGTSTLSGTIIAGGPIQGLAGEDEPYLQLSSGEARLYGDGSTPPTALLDSAWVRLYSPDGSTDVSVTDASASMTSGSAYVEVNGSTNSTILNGSSIYATSPFAIPAGENVPSCDATIAPNGYAAFMVDTTGPDLCMCDGTAWIPVDGTGECTVSGGDEF